VIYSPWIDTITYYLLDVGSDTIIGTLPAPKLDATILNTGEIKVYANLGDASNPYVISLPYVNDTAGGFIREFSFVGGIDIWSNLNIDGLPLRYVLIPGGTTARTANGKTINWDNYAEVKAYLKLED
jgi:hypothetical protein